MLVGVVMGFIIIIASVPLSAVPLTHRFVHSLTHMAHCCVPCPLLPFQQM